MKFKSIISGMVLTCFSHVAKMLSNKPFLRSSPSLELQLILREPFRLTSMTTEDELTTSRDRRED